ncbi:MAG TPA: glycosyltransferase family 4 protein [Chloroflexota bacterium]|nr:glycosyltransferase family 4 protein [Chloroflexota bacterium]
MRIAQVAPPFESVPPTHYGGTERVVSLLTEELVRRGHEVTLFASGDSTTSARLIPTVDTALWRQPQVRDPLVYWSITLGEAYRRAARGEFDLIHSHLDFLAWPLAALCATPTVTTLHGRLDLPDLPRICARFPEMPLVSISESQRAPLPRANWVATVYNGVDTDRLSFHEQPGDYLAFLGRIAPEKGVEHAIQIARRAGMPLKIAARMPLQNSADPNAQRDWDYYRAVVAPLLKEPEVEYIGEVSDRDKADFLGHARALLFPIDWPEPFGLVMAEALACGTPVVARRRGAVPEVVVDGVTGLIGDTNDELVQLCGHIDRLSRAACRADAVRRFSPRALADGYEAAYRRVLEGSAVPSLTANGGLAWSPAGDRHATWPISSLVDGVCQTV